jgi:hypothetical protein
MKIKEVKELPPEETEVSEEKKEEPKEESEELILEEDNPEEGLSGEIEQFRAGFPMEFSPEALLLSSALEEKLWQPKNLEESLKEVPGKMEEENSRGGDCYSSNSPGGIYGVGSDLYKASGSDLYNEGGGEDAKLYNTFDEKEEDVGELRHANASRLEIVGLRSGFGRMDSRDKRKDSDKRKYAA